MIFCIDVDFLENGAKVDFLALLDYVGKGSLCNSSMAH
jgi:hypothetical protein